MPKPENLKLVKDHGLKAIAFAGARRGSLIYFGTSDFKVCEADPAAMKFEPKELYGHASYVTGLAMAGTTLVSGAYDGKLTWYDTEAKKVIRSEDAHKKWIRGVVASRDGKLVASVADDMVCRVWDAASGKKLHELKGHAETTPQSFSTMLYAAAFSDDGKHLATADKIGKAVVWEVATGKKLAEVEAPIMYTWDQVHRLHSIGGIRSVAFSPDGKTLAVGGTGKIGNIDHLEAKFRVETFDWATQKRTGEYASDKHLGIVNHLEYAADGSWLMAAGGANEGFLAFLSPDLKKVLRADKANMHVHDVVTSGDSLIAVGHNKISVYDMKG